MLQRRVEKNYFSFPVPISRQRVNAQPAMTKMIWITKVKSGCGLGISFRKNCKFVFYVVRNRNPNHKTQFPAVVMHWVVFVFGLEINPQIQKRLSVNVEFIPFSDVKVWRQRSPLRPIIICQPPEILRQLTFQSRRGAVLIFFF